MCERVPCSGGRRLNFLPLFSPSSFLPRPPPKMIVPCPTRSAEEEEEGPTSLPVRPSCLSLSHSPPILGAFLRHSSSSRDGNISRRRRRRRRGRRRRRRRQSQSVSPPRAWTMAATTKVSFSHMHKDKTKRGGGGSDRGALVYRAVRFGHFRTSPFLFFRGASTSASPSDCLG